MKGDGDCFYKNGEIFIKSKEFDCLCHGSVLGQGAIKGIRHIHEYERY